MNTNIPILTYFNLHQSELLENAKNGEFYEKSEILMRIILNQNHQSYQNYHFDRNFDLD